MCVTRNIEITAYDQPLINDGTATKITTSDMEINVFPDSVEVFDGGAAPVIIFMGSAAVKGVAYRIMNGIQTVNPTISDDSNVTHLVLRKQD